MSSIPINAPDARILYPGKEVAFDLNNYQFVIQTILWSAGIIIFCLALVDFYAHTYARETEVGLQLAQIEKLKINQDLRISDIKPFIVGSPNIQTRPADKYIHMCKEMKQYTWHGFFKSYSISVYIGISKDPSIDFIHGTNDLALRAESTSSNH
ncbi:MAG: hypothetical protein K0U86_06055 [Planctomycetes bacterium]|nr:hypothetical protein [Planctomycetota bacterium]MCH9778192.1 hypothetical protein [Planctomycetota bacterium]MDF1746560.1 hypothetical protein [Gimesia sp.]